MHATSSGKDTCVRLLLPVSDALAKDKDGWTALMWAAGSGFEGCVSLLLPASDALAPDNEGWTALIQAAHAGEEACVKILLPASDALARDESGLTAKDWAYKGGYDDLARFIGAYALSKSERDEFEVAAHSGAPSGRSVRRV